MKLGSVLTAAAAAVMVTATPVMAEGTRSAGSLPSISAPSKAVSVRRASKAGANEDLVGVPVLVILAGVGAVFVVLDAVGVFHVIWDS